MRAAEAHRLTMREAILEGIRTEMAADDAVVLVGQDLGEFAGPLKSAEGILAQFGAARIIETPICEGSMTTMAVGAALNGLRPIVDIMFSDLLPVAMTALVQVAANVRYLTDGAATAPIVVRTRGGDGPYRAHPQNYEALFCHSPGLVVVCPSNSADAKGLIRAAIRSDDPVLFIENIYLYNAVKEHVPDGDYITPLGRAAIARTGSDMTVVTYGRAVRTSVTAAEQLASEGIDVEVIDLRTLAPFDEPTIMASVGKTCRLVTVHEAWRNGGLGAEITARVAERTDLTLKAAPVRIGAPPIAVPWAEALRDEFVPTPERIASAVRAAVHGECPA